MMRAIRIHRYGGLNVLHHEEVAVPVIKPDEVLIKVHAAGVNPIDWKIREGHLNADLPLILGWDVSGEVAALGKNVTAYKRGDLVFAHANLGCNGAYAEYIAVATREIAPKPTSTDHVQSAALPIAALTAWQALFEVAELRSGQTVLIHAAAGGVGHLAVQLAKNSGAKVIATASKQNHAFLKKLGADQTLDYQTPDFEKTIKQVDVVLDTIGGETQDRSWKVLKAKGMLVSIADHAHLEENSQKYNIKGKYLGVQPNGETLAEIAKLVDAQKLIPEIAATFPLTEAAQAHQLSQAGHVRGKIVLTIK